ncbi:MAG: hypothetical protein SFW09_17290 [Hyphomicrobiaceae bacterium]|nr:hypothetical protein [Hyphomicrobiaceae bacterium]
MTMAGPGLFDLAVGGSAVALATLQVPAGGEPQKEAAERVVAALQAAASRPLEMRRVMMGARTAGLQALILTVKSFRGCLLLGEVAAPGIDVDWLYAAERSLEAAVRGDALTATQLGGTVPRWPELSPTTIGDVAAIGDAALWRRRAEAVAEGDLQLALAPESLPRALIAHLLAGSRGGCPGWLDAFGLYLAWQMRSRPELACACFGCTKEELEQPRSEGAKTFDAIAYGAQAVARAFERCLPKDDVLPASSGRVIARISGGDRAAASLSEAVRVVSSSMHVPAAPMHRHVMWLGSRQLPPVMLGRLLIEEAALLRDLMEWLRDASHPALAEAARLIVDGRIEAAIGGVLRLPAPRGDADHALRCADLQHVGGNYLDSVDGYGRAFEAALPDAKATRIGLQLRMARALCLQVLATAEAKHHRLAVSCAERALADAKAEGGAVSACRAAVLLGRLAVLAPDPDASRARMKAVEALAAAVANAEGAHPGAERIEALAVEVELLASLSGGEVKDRERRLEAAEGVARRWCERDVTDALPATVCGLPHAILGLVLLARATDGDTRQRAQEATVALEIAAGSTAARMDLLLAGSIASHLGAAHLQLAGLKDKARAREEAAAIALTRAMHAAPSMAEVARSATALQEALSMLAQGPSAERRLRQALAAFEVAESAIAPGKSSETRATAYVLRSTLCLKLGVETGDPGDFEDSVASAELGIAMLRALDPKQASTSARARLIAALKAKAMAQLERGRMARDLAVLEQCDGAFQELLAQAETARLPPRERCALLASRGQALDFIVEREPIEMVAQEARERAMSVYEQIVRIAKASNLDEPRRSAEDAMVRLAATRDVPMA